MADSPESTLTEAKKAPRRRNRPARSGATSGHLVGHRLPRVVAEEPFRPPACEIDYPDVAWSDSIDRLARANLARLTAGTSPVSVLLAWTDWASNFAMSPGKQAHLAKHAWAEAAGFAEFALGSLTGTAEPVVQPQPNDKRFESDRWRSPPFSLYQQAFLMTERWWHNATHRVRGVSGEHETLVSFITRQMLDVWSPSNFFATNPDLLEVTRAEGGRNLWRGMQNWLHDATKQLGDAPPDAGGFMPGKDVAVTPGRVVYRNHLIELIQYEPQTGQVHPEPILIVPAWIMKYYILDLSPDNSFIDYLVKQGHTVFAISWRNPGSEDSGLTMEDYRRLGPMAALDAITAIVPDQKVHALGYCLGGTLMAITAAAMARDGDDRLMTLSLLAAQVDFTDAGELTMFVDANGLALLEDMMWSQGYLDAKQMAGAFTLLRSNDLFWSRLLNEYYFGRHVDRNEMMAWNADATRMPYAMHSQYLRQLFLENRLTEGKYRVDGRPVALNDVEVPVFAVGTARDHVAPWHSVYKIHLFTDAPVTFLLASGGHNGGIVSPPGHPRRIYQVGDVHDHETYVDPDRWRLATPVRKGSWWPEYCDWLAARSGEPVDPPRMGNTSEGYPALEAAPGTYVHMR